MPACGKYMQLCEESPFRVVLVNKLFLVITKQDHLCFLPFSAPIPLHFLSDAG